MKTLKFRQDLVKEIMEDRKTSTWRLFDDKDLSVGDKLDFVDWESGKKFAEAEITNVKVKNLGEIEESDFLGHEKYISTEDMLEHYRQYYGDRVAIETPVKIIDFKILKKQK